MTEKKIQHKHLHTLVLAIILVFACVTFSFLQGKPDLQFLVGAVSALSYILWGIIYHVVEGDLYPKVVVEYILVSTLGLILLYTVLYI